MDDFGSAHDWRGSVGGGDKGLKYLASFALCTLMVASFVAAIWWASELPAGAQGGVFQGGQKFVTITTASTNCSTIGIPGPHQILELSLQSISATNMYLHLYDIATTPVAGALPGQIGVYALPALLTPQAGGFATTLGPLGASVQNGIGFCITNLPALADATNATVGGIVNWTIK